MLPWILCIVFFVLCVILIVKNRLMQRALDKLGEDLWEHLDEPTNTLISVSSRDAHIRKLASEINIQLRLLRKDRQRFQNGDKELKEAVTNISHDLRTPLTAICGYLELLDREKKSETVQRYLDAISDRAEALKSLTEELFRYSVILSDDKEFAVEKISLSSVLEEALTGMYGAFQSRDITPEIEMPEEPVFCKGNKDALLRVVNNILSNAFKYSAGDLSVRLSENGTAEFSNLAPNMDSVDAGKLFDRFYTVDVSRNSTGLGLSIARHLTEQMGGSLSAKYESERLTITLSLHTY